MVRTQVGMWGAGVPTMMLSAGQTKAALGSISPIPFHVVYDANYDINSHSTSFFLTSQLLKKVVFKFIIFFNVSNELVSSTIADRK